MSGGVLLGKLDKTIFFGAIASIATVLAASLLYPISFSDLVFNFGLFHTNAIGALLILCTPLAALYFLIHREMISLRILDIVLLVTLAFVTVRGLIAAAKWDSGSGMVIYYSGAAFYLYYFSAVVGQRYKGSHKLLYILAGITVVVVAYTFIEFWYRRNVLFDEMLINVTILDRNYYRSGSTLGHPVWLGLFLVQVVPLFILFYFAVNRTALRVLLAGIVAAIIVAVEMTFSKGAWGTAIALCGASLLLVVRHPEKRRLAAILFLVVAMSIAVFTIFSASDVQSGLFSKKRQGETYKPRMYMWERAPAVFLEHPLFGVGLLAGPNEISLREGQELYKSQPISIDNQYLTLLAEQGLFGIMLVAASFFLICQEAWQLIRRQGDRNAWLIALVAGIAAVAIDGFTFNAALTWPNLIVFWLFAGLLRAMYETQSRSLTQVHA